MNMWKGRTAYLMERFSAENITQGIVPSVKGEMFDYRLGFLHADTNTVLVHHYHMLLQRVMRDCIQHTVNVMLECIPSQVL